MKKNILMIALLALGLASCNKPEENKTAATGTTKQASGRIVYVNTDTLLNNYQYYKDVVKEFEGRKAALESDLQKRSQAFQSEVASLQKKAQSGGLTEEQGRAAQMQLQKKEQDIMAYRDNAAAKMQEEQSKKTDKLLTNIHDYLKKYNSSDKYDMVIGYSKGGGVLYAKEDLDITADVLKGLNEDYKANGGKSEEAKK